MMARIALWLLSTLLVTILAENEINIFRNLPNFPILYRDDIVNVTCNGGQIGSSPSQLLIEFDDFQDSSYGCSFIDGNFTLIEAAEFLISINPSSAAQCRAMFEGEYQLEFTPKLAGLTYRCRMNDDGVNKTSQIQTLPSVLYELPTDTTLTVNGSDFYEGSGLNALCSVNGSVPATTMFLYKLNGQGHVVSGPLILQLTRDMAGEITCTSTEHVNYRNREQPGLVSSPLTVNVYYFELNTAAEIERDFNPSSSNSLNCEDFISTNLMSADITYAWKSNDEILSTSSMLVLPVNVTTEIGTTKRYTCDIAGPLFRDTDADSNTLQLNVAVTWSLSTTTTPLATKPPTTTKPANAAAIGASVGVGVRLVVAVVIVVAVAGS